MIGRIGMTSSKSPKRKRPSKAAPTASASDIALEGKSEIPPVSLTWLRSQQDCDIDIPGLIGSLRGYQRVGVAGAVCSPRMVLADDPGLGKTVQTLSALRWLEEARHVSRTLLVCPRALLHQWVEETEKWFPGQFHCMVVEGTKPQRAKMYERLAKFDGHPLHHRNLVLTSYALLRNDLELIQNTRFDQIVFDEISVLRNHQAEQTKAAAKVVANIPRRLGLSATPMQNHLEEYFTVMSLIDDKVLGSRERFLRRYCNTTQIPIIVRGRRRFITKITGYRGLEFFKEELEQSVLRRTIEEVGGQMPTLTVVDRWVDLTTKQQTRYDEVESGLLTIGEESSVIEAHQQVLRLSQICNDLHLVYPDEEGSAKVDELARLLTTDLDGRQVVLFSKSVKFFQNSVHPLLQRLNLSYGNIMGTEDSHQVDYARRQFQDGKLQVICMTTAGEMGLNLDAAAHMVCLDVLYNEARMRQVYGRIRRASSVHTAAVVIRLLARNTLEERALQVLEQRGALLDYLDSPEFFNADQMADLLKLVNRRVSLLGEKA